MLYCGYDNFTGEEDDLMQDRKLEQALEIYFQENPDIRRDTSRRAAQTETAQGQQQEQKKGASQAV